MPEPFLAITELDIVKKGLEVAVDPDSALRLVQQNKSFSYHVFDPYKKRVGALKFRGVEVALFYRIQDLGAGVDEAGELQEPKWLRYLVNGRVQTVASAPQQAQPKLVNHAGALIKLQQDLNTAKQELDMFKDELANAEQALLAKVEELEQVQQQLVGALNDNKQLWKILQNELWEDLTGVYDAACSMEPKLQQCIRVLLEKVADKCMVSVIVPRVGDDFNPHEQEAVAVDPEEAEGKITRVYRVGIRVGQYAQRPAVVVVGSRETKETGDAQKPEEQNAVQS